MIASCPAVFLDRDGVLVIPHFRDGRSFAPRRLEEFAIYPDAAACMGRLKAAGFKLIVATNQPDVGNGLVDRAIVEAMHARLADVLPLDGIEVCYHTRADHCLCRKPQPGMLQAAAREFALDMSRSFMVGDRASDIAAGIAAGCRTVFVDLGYTAESPPDDPTYHVTTIAGATEAILQHREQIGRQDALTEQDAASAKDALTKTLRQIRTGKLPHETHE